MILNAYNWVHTIRNNDMSVKKWIQHLSSDIIFDIFVYEILVLAHTTPTCFLFLLFHQFFLLLTIGRFGYFVHKQSHSSQRSANKREFISYCRSWSSVMTLFCYIYIDWRFILLTETYVVLLLSFHPSFFLQTCSMWSPNQCPLRYPLC